MGLRETLNRNPAITTGATIAIIIVALIAILWQTMGGSGPGKPATQGYFTTDNGATWFADSLDNLPPYQKDGKEAVRIYLFKCADGKPFVAYMERYTPEFKKMLTEAKEKMKANPNDPMAMQAAYSMPMQSGTEVKKPGDTGPWRAQMRDYQAYAQVVQIKCPDGTTESLEPVQP